MTSATTPRTSGPDVLKGALMVLVVFGHTIPEGVGGSFTKWLIYGVHMPAFMFLSGYLVTVASLRRRTYPQFLRHYWRRMLLPWLVVSLVWGYTFGTFSRDHLLRSLLELVIRPQWHLWYVPVLFAILSLAWVAVRLRSPAVVLGTAAVIGTVVWATPLAHDLVGTPSDRLGDPHYFTFVVWFALGLALRNGTFRAAADGRAALTGIGVSGLVMYATAYWLGGDAAGWAQSIGFLALNTALVILVVPWAVARLSRTVSDDSFLAFAGRHSLWIYLLHPFATEPVHDLDLPTLPQRLLALTVTAAVFGVVALAYRRRPRTVIDLREAARTGQLHA
jgi:acyltransferase